MTSILFAMMTATGMYVVMAKLGLFKLFKIKETRKVADGGLDVLVTFGLVVVFAGTVSGMLIGMMSGLMLSGMLFATRCFIKPSKSIRGICNGANKRIRRILSLLRRTPNNAVT